MITRMECFSPALNVINIYGEQRKTNKEEVEGKWSRLLKDMEAIRARKEFCWLGGDMNKLVGCSELGVPGNNPEVSLGGRLLLDLLATRNWYLVNGLGQEIVEGGPFTRQDPATGGLSSLDLFIVSRELRPYVKSLVIDSDRRVAIGRVVRMGAKYQTVNSDHFTVILTLTNLPRVQEKNEEKRVMWNLAKEGGWKKYENISEELSDALMKVVEDKKTNIEEKMEKFDKIHDKIKYKAFGKVTITQKKQTYNHSEGETDESKELKGKEIY